MFNHHWLQSQILQISLNKEMKKNIDNSILFYLKKNIYITCQILGGDIEIRPPVSLIYKDKGVNLIKMNCFKIKKEFHAHINSTHLNKKLGHIGFAGEIILK